MLKWLNQYSACCCTRKGSDSHETKNSVFILLCFLMQQSDSMVLRTTSEGSSEIRTPIVLHFLLLLSKLFSFLHRFSKLAIVFLFRTWVNTLVVFVFKCWCLFLDINQRWLFWGDLQWITASENVMDDLPNFTWALRLFVFLPLVGSLLSWGEVIGLIYPCPQLCMFEYSNSDGGQNAGHNFVPTVSALLTPEI